MNFLFRASRPHFLRSISIGLSLLPLGLTSAAISQTPLKILTDASVMEKTYLPDFSFAGYNHGVGDIPTLKGQVIDVTTYGVIADDKIDDSKAMVAALDAAHAVSGPVIVQLPKGRILVSELLKIKRGDIVLRGLGSGAQGTDLHFPRPLQMIETGESFSEIRRYLKKYDKRQKEVENNVDVLFSEYSWTGGFIWVQKEGTRAASYLDSEDPDIIVLANAMSGTVGTQNVLVEDSARLSVGDVVELQWANAQGENGPLVKEMYGDTDVSIGSRHWTYPDRPLVRQKTEILSISGNQLKISDPLLHTISSAIPAQFAQWDHMTNVGIEDLHISFPESPSFGHHMERGYNGIYLTSVFNGWIRDVSVHNADAGILSYNSANVTVSNIETTGNRRGHYSVHLGNVHNMIVKNLTVNNPTVHSLSLNTQSTKCVFKDAIVNQTAVLDQHAGANHQNLFDNITVKIEALRDASGAYYPIWDGSGAGYWQPGHGRYNTTWNLKVNVMSGADRTETVSLQGLAEGPDARLVGISGNRNFDVKYVPMPYVEGLNRTMEDVPSLYDYQLQKRLQP